MDSTSFSFKFTMKTEAFQAILDHGVLDRIPNGWNQDLKKELSRNWFVIIHPDLPKNITVMLHGIVQDHNNPLNDTYLLELNIPVSELYLSGNFSVAELLQQAKACVAVLKGKAQNLLIQFTGANPEGEYGFNLTNIKPQPFLESEKVLRLPIG